MSMEYDGGLAEARRRGREHRWMARTKATVKHPHLGQVVVPHRSNLAALENAAEYWKVPVDEIWHEASVWVFQPGDGPLVRPKEFYRRTSP